MNQNRYRLYQDDTITLAETMIIKSEASAQEINEYMAIKHGPHSFNPNQKQTWKYYMNLSGQYHGTDPIMRVYSLDTLSEIDFTVSNLAHHSATKAAYSFNSRYYRELLFRYPDQELLIRGIIDPVDIHRAINAQPYEIINYDHSLVEPQERDLISNIQNWIYGWVQRWDNPQYRIPDAWYHTSMLGVLYALLPPLIMNQRLKTCKTDQAHSFHIRQYLASHGMLDAYMDSMTLKQILFFYRNILYIEKNAGKQSTFNWLKQKVLTDRNLPLAELNLQLSSSAMPNSLEPTAMFESSAINEVPSSVRQPIALPQLLAKENSLARQNREYSQEHLSRMDRLLKRSLSTKLPTKVLESNAIDNSDDSDYMLHLTYLNQWIHGAATAQMSHLFIRIKSAQTGSELQMNLLDAYLYFVYAYAASIGLELKELPKLPCMRIPIYPAPTKQELLKIVDPAVVPQSYAQYLIDLSVQTSYPTTFHDYRSYCQAVTRSYSNQLLFAYQQEDMQLRAYIYNMIHRLYQDEWHPAVSYSGTYKEYLQTKALEVQSKEASEWTKIYKDIYKQVTGEDIDNANNASSMQKAMISLFEQLSSYSIQFITDLATTTTRSLNHNSLRLSKDKSKANSYQEILLGIWKIFGKRIKAKDIKKLELDYLFNKIIINRKSKTPFIQIPIDITRSKANNKATDILNLGGIKLNDDTWPLPSTLDLAHTPGWQDFMALDKSKHKDIRTVYCECYKPITSPDKVDINKLIGSAYIPGFAYHKQKDAYMNMFHYVYYPKQNYTVTSYDADVTLNAFTAWTGDINLKHFVYTDNFRRVDP